MPVEKIHQRRSQHPARTPEHAHSTSAKPTIDRAPTPADAVQRAVEMPTELLRIEDVIRLQQTLGNRATARMLKPQHTPPRSESAPSGDAPVIQRNYVGALIDYNVIKQEKKQGEIKTGWKLHASLTERVKTLHNAIKSGKIGDIQVALLSVQERLLKDSQKDLKAPKTISAPKQKEAATQFFAKWLRIVQEHLEYLKLNQGKAVADFQESYGYSNQNILALPLALTSTSSMKEEALPKEKSAKVNFNDPPWEMMVSAEVKSSGMGGAIIVTFGGGKLVVKRNSPQEVLGARMAQASGLPIPETRLASGGETERISKALQGLKITEQLKWGAPYTVIDFVSGIDVNEVFGEQTKVTKGQVLALAASMGRWFAFSMISGDIDNFYRLTGTGTGVNSGNFRVTSPTSENVVGFDQTATGGTQSKAGDALEDILAGDGFFGMGIATDILNALGNPKGIDSESLIPVILGAAKEQLKQSTKMLSRETLLQMNKDLEYFAIGNVIDRVEQLAKKL